MKVSEILGVICLIFASNFKGVIEKEALAKIAKKWILINQNSENKTAHEFWEKFLAKKDENLEAVLAEISADFENLKPNFEISHFKLISETDMKLFFEKVRYEAPFKELSLSHASNMLAFLMAILKHDTDEKTHNLLGFYLTKFYMPSFRALASVLQINAKSDYYKALGWFLADFNKMIKDALGLKI